MKQLDKGTLVFLELLRAGLWEQEVWLLRFGSVDYSRLYDMAQEQSVVGLIAAGLKHVVDTNVPQEIELIFLGNTIQLEKRNNAMNSFIGVTIEKMRRTGIYTLLMKGQGIAQCYERPQWRASGDIDFLLIEDNFDKALRFLSPLASSIDENDSYKKHLPMTIDSWLVELHGTLRGGLRRRMDKVLDDVQHEIFCSDEARSWMDNGIQVFLPKADEDVVYVFSHFLQHFFRGGIGLRQICDWCRLLWTYRKEIDTSLLESRIRKMGAMTEWKAFATLAVDFLGMPADAMPFYSQSACRQRKSRRIMNMVLETGNFGKKRDKSYFKKYPFVVYKTISLFRNTWDSIRQAFIFPLDSLIVWWVMFLQGVTTALKGK